MSVMDKCQEMDLLPFDSGCSGLCEALKGLSMNPVLQALTLMAHLINRANLGSAIGPDPALGKSISLSLNLQYLNPFIPTYLEHKVPQVFISTLSFCHEHLPSTSVTHSLSDGLHSFGFFAAHKCHAQRNNVRQRHFFHLLEA